MRWTSYPHAEEMLALLQHNLSDPWFIKHRPFPSSTHHMKPPERARPHISHGFLVNMEGTWSHNNDRNIKSKVYSKLLHSAGCRRAQSNITAENGTQAAWSWNIKVEQASYVYGPWRKEVKRNGLEGFLFKRLDIETDFPLSVWEFKTGFPWNT